MPLDGATPGEVSACFYQWVGYWGSGAGAFPSVVGNWEGFLERFLCAVRTGLPAAGLLSDHQLDCTDQAGTAGSGDGGSAGLLFSVQS